MKRLAIVATLLLLLVVVSVPVGCGRKRVSPTSTATAIATSIPAVTPTLPPTTTPSLTPTEEAALPELQVHFIDVGQGDSILLDLGKLEVLIDGGERSPGAVPYLKKYVDGSLEAMVATHPHADHIGGLMEVLSAFKVEAIWLNGDTSTSQTYSDFMAAVQAEGAEVHTARLGDRIHAGELTFTVLNPASLDNTTNNNSIVLSLSYGEVDFLFAGDAEKEAEARMLTQSVVPVPDVEILKVGHHGSRTASSPGFLEAVKPEVAIYMAGKDNQYGHPHAETISALEAIGAQVYGTDIHGTIVVATDGEKYTVQPTRQAPPRAPPTASMLTPAPLPTLTPTATATPTPTATARPSPTPTPTPTATSALTFTPAPQALTLQIVSVTSPVSPGANATLVAKTAPGAQCAITVYYKSGPSSAAGLYPKGADSAGSVSWTWKVGTRTTAGSWRIVVSASLDGETISQTTYFTVQ